MPVLLTLLPFFGKEYFSHTSEMILVLVSILIAIGIQTKDYRAHKNSWPLVLISISVIVFVFAFWGFDGSYETILSPFGSFIMAFSFILNWNLHRKHCSNHMH
jgi:MerC mercury resistance protein